jgi:transcription antitermination factor NusG
MNTQQQTTYQRPLTQGAVRAATNEIQWYAVHTRCQHEKKVLRQLTEKGVIAFLPLAAVTRRWSDRNKVVEMPLFPGYVFVRVSLSVENRLAILQASGVAGFVGMRGWGTPIPDKQIEDLQTLLSRKLALEPYPFLREGRRVRVRGGCLDGIEGILVECISDRSLVLSVESIQRSVSIRVADYKFEPIQTTYVHS